MHFFVFLYKHELILFWKLKFPNFVPQKMAPEGVHEINEKGLKN